MFHQRMFFWPVHLDILLFLSRLETEYPFSHWQTQWPLLHSSQYAVSFHLGKCFPPLHQQICTLWSHQGIYTDILRISLHYLLSSIWEVFLNLVISKLENLESIWKCGLRCLGLCKVIDHFLICIGLFNVIVVKVDDSVAIREHLPFDSIVKDHFLLSIFIYSLNLTVVPNYLLHHFVVCWPFVVIVCGKFHVKVFRVIVCDGRYRVLWLVVLLTGIVFFVLVKPQIWRMRGFIVVLIIIV